jgi:hypothetical protein
MVFSVILQASTDKKLRRKITKICQFDAKPSAKVGK